MEGNTTNGNITFDADGTGTMSGNTIRNNIRSSGTGTILHSCPAKVSISGNSGFTVNAYTGTTARLAAERELKTRLCPFIRSRLLTYYRFPFRPGRPANSG